MQFILQSPTQKVIEEIIKENNSNLFSLLKNDSFMIYCRNTDPIAIEFICKNVDQMLNILFADYNLIPKEQLEQYGEQINNIWEIIELNLEPILKQIEIHWSIIFELLYKQFVPDIQWGLAYKLLNLVKERDSSILQDLLKQQDFLVSFLPFLNIHSVSQILIAFFEIGFNQQQINFLKKGLEFYKQQDLLSIINFTYIVHEIMTRILIDQQLEYILNGEFLKEMFDIIIQDNIDPIILKNAAHIISLISNFYTMDMQNINLDDPDSSDIVTQFKQTPFFINFDVSKIDQIFQKSVQKKLKVGLFIIKLVEIIDNLVRITDLQLWDQIAESNIMGLIFQLMNEFRNADIFSIYVENMVIFIFDKALNDYHPFWAYYLIQRYKLQNKNIGHLYRLIYQFDINLEQKLLRDTDNLPYIDTLRLIQNELKISKIWNAQKMFYINQEERNKTKLGEDTSTPKKEIDLTKFLIEQNLILEEEQISRGYSAIEIKSCQNNHTNPNQLFQNVQLNVFENITISKNIGEFDCNSQSEENDKTSNQIPEDSSEKQDNQFEQRLSNQSNKNLQDRFNKSCFGMSYSLQYEERKDKFLSGSLQIDFKSFQYNFKRVNSLKFSQELRKDNKNFEEFKIEILKNKKVLKKHDNSILKVDEIDQEANLNIEQQEQQKLDSQQQKQQNSLHKLT
ncbi:unnamed protein product [Paramecium pentaurelia]|uniref:Uncharacterized protein n=1 Tax=Paramecium pentaurelia TaxID=43138 RepID=A0A8S1TM31_9CILI|nr:unnamed protein product [Paramecium pentaurelia]